MATLLKIIHPYLGTLLIDTFHPLLIMRKMGRSLLQAIQYQELLSSWRNSGEVRRKCLVEVGMSALNVVQVCRVCHNYIRLANITVRNPQGAASGTSIVASEMDNHCTAGRTTGLRLTNSARY